MNKNKLVLNNLYKGILTCGFFILAFFINNNVYAQADSLKADTRLKQPIPQNAGFDVIVKTNGELVYGLVKEVGPDFITYQRTDIPDGPIYTMPRVDVYVISYRNQVKDYINGSSAEPAVSIDPTNDRRYINYKEKNLFQNGVARIELGFLRSFTKVKNSKNYSSSGSFPAISFAYEVSYKDNINLGAQIGFGSHKFTGQQFSSYDSTKTDVSLKENIFALYVYGRYYLLNNTSRLQPYIMAGLGITSSNIHSENIISFTNDNSQKILVKSGTRSTGLGITARAGAEYFLSEQLQLSADAGVGLSVINVGLAITLK